MDITQTILNVERRVKDFTEALLKSEHELAATLRLSESQPYNPRVLDALRGQRAQYNGLVKQLEKAQNELAGLLSQYCTNHLTRLKTQKRRLETCRGATPGEEAARLDALARIKRAIETHQKYVRG